ncbi:helix-turn-helix domain-containing protein [Burkholderia sp. SCN-KJ]|nr:helix-turn-helix domain-containing protein [Burkholderia sp. SCN-KJ]
MRLTDREHGGMTQAKLAEACDCGQRTISDLARGITKRPNADLGLRLLEIYKQISNASMTDLEEGRKAGVDPASAGEEQAKQ